jgi:hypothetical protein
MPEKQKNTQIEELYIGARELLAFCYFIVFTCRNVINFHVSLTVLYFYPMVTILNQNLQVHHEHDYRAGKKIDNYYRFSFY